MIHELESGLLLSIIVAGMVACASRGASPSQAPPPSQTEHSEAESETPSPSHGAHSAGEHSEASAGEPSEASAAKPPARTPTRATPAVAPVEEERTAYDAARPVFDTYCANCHTSRGSKSSKSAIGHFSMDAYPFGGHHADDVSAAIRKVLGVSGAPATMPRDRPGSVTGEELQLILAWAEARDRASTRPASGGHDHTKHQH